MGFVKRKNEWMKSVDHQIDQSQRKYGPDSKEHDFSAASSFVKKSDDIAGPCQHGQEQKDKIEHAVGVQKREKSIAFMMGIQYPPENIANEIQVRRHDKKMVASPCQLLLLVFLLTGVVL
jgi:hypothetical protein